MFTFDKLNRTIGSVGKVPVIADMMPSKWAYEALMVHQYKDNKLSKEFFEVEEEKSNADFKKVYYIPTLREHLQSITENINNTDKNVQNAVSEDLRLLRNEFSIQLHQINELSFNSLQNLQLGKFNEETAAQCEEFLTIFSS